MPTTPINETTSDQNLKRDLSLAKRTKGISCRNDRTKPDADVDCSKCLIDNGFAADYDTGDIVWDTDLCDSKKRDVSPPSKSLAIFLRNETTIDNATLHAHLDKRAVSVSKIEKCRLQWSSAKYDSCSAFQKKTGKYYYDDYNQKSCVDFSVWPWPQSQRTGKGQYASKDITPFIKSCLEFPTLELITDYLQLNTSTSLTSSRNSSSSYATENTTTK